MQNKIYCFPDLTRAQAERLLARSSAGTFLVRQSTSEIGNYYFYYHYNCFFLKKRIHHFFLKKKTQFLTIGAWVLSSKQSSGSISHSILRIVVRTKDGKTTEEYTLELGKNDSRTFPSIEWLADELDLDPLEVIKMIFLLRFVFVFSFFVCFFF